MIKKQAIYLAAIFLLNSNVVPAQSKEVGFLIDTCITIMKNHAVGRHDINWAQLNRDARAKAGNIDDPHQLGAVMRYVYQSVNDFHGTFFYMDSTFKWKPSRQPVSDSVMNEWKKGVSIKSMMLNSRVGYLRVPYMSFNGREDADKNAQMLNDTLCVLLERNVKGIVLDLRLNGGGAMYPMMLGLQSLLGTGKIGAFVGGSGESWYLQNNNFLLDTVVVTGLARPCPVRAENLPVVVLVGFATGSSGEFLAMAFKGRKNTVQLGTKTAGYVTSVAGFPINQAAYMYLSTGYGMDRNGNVYKEAIEPDLAVNAPDSFNDIKNDRKVLAAVNWLADHAR